MEELLQTMREAVKEYEEAVKAHRSLMYEYVSMTPGVSPMKVFTEEAGEAFIDLQKREAAAHERMSEAMNAVIQANSLNRAE